MFQTLFAFITAALVAFSGLLLWSSKDLPAVETLSTRGVRLTHWTQVFATDGTPILSYGKFQHQPAQLAQISPYFIDALIATEDRRFYSHPGVDPIAMARSILRNIRYGKFLEGGSTLSQQLARNVFLSNERSLKRKLKEAVLAVQLERKFSKQQILELYVNNIYFGEGAYGIAAASKVYFNKKPSDLTLEEGAFLAGLPQAPSGYSPYQNLKAATARRNEVLHNLMETGKITPQQYETSATKGFNLNPAGQDAANGDRAPYFNRYVLNQILQQFDIDEQTFWQSGLKIYTTLDLRAQMLAVQALRAQAGRQQGAILSLNPQTGAILAYVGGKRYASSQYDRVTQAVRSPGSTFKVFTYITAIQRGYTPNRVYLDEPIQAGNWVPKNYDGEHHGYMTLAQALAKSNNIVAVKLIQELTPRAVIDTARHMGLQAQLEDNLALTLGSSGVTLYDMTNALSALANQGVRAEAYAVDRVKDREDRVIYEHRPAKVTVLDRRTTDTIVAMMQGVIQFGTGKGADIGRPMAGKTGTSDDNRDGWFIGFTPNVITGVWVGNDDNSAVPGLAGGATPARIWKQYMQAYFANTPLHDFDLSDSMPLTDADFSTYDLKNLGNGEPNKPVEPETTDGNPQAGQNGQDGQLEADPNNPNALPPSGNPSDSSSNNHHDEDAEASSAENDDGGPEEADHNSPLPPPSAPKIAPKSPRAPVPVGPPVPQ